MLHEEIRDFIFVLDRTGDEWSYRMCSIELPEDCYSHSVCTRTNMGMRNEFLICGYCRNESKDDVPMEVCTLIARWLVSEMIHFHENLDSKEPLHFALSVDDIVQAKGPSFKRINSGETKLT